MEERHDDPVVGEMDPYWESLQFVRTLIVPLPHRGIFNNYSMSARWI